MYCLISVILGVLFTLVCVVLLFDFTVWFAVCFTVHECGFVWFNVEFVRVMICLGFCFEFRFCGWRCYCFCLFLLMLVC